MASAASCRQSPGPGSSARVHARSARLAGARVVGVAASSPESGPRQPARSADARLRLAPRSWSRDPDIDVVHVCTPNHLHLPLAAGRARARASTWSARSHSRSTPPAPSSSPTPRPAGPPGSGAVRVPLLPDRPRGARARPPARPARCTSLHGTLPPGLAPAPRGRQLARGRELGGASRAFADIGSHWCDLAEFMSGQRVTRLSARMLTAVPERPRRRGRHAFRRWRRHGELRPVRTEDAAVVQFETDAGALGSRRDQSGLGRPQEQALDRDRRLGGGAGLRPGAARRALGRSPRAAETIVRRDPGSLSRRGRRYAYLPGGHPQGYADCFDAFVADFYEAVETGGCPTGCRRSPTGCAPTASPRPCWPRRASGEWVDVATTHEAVAG